jgi:hypothetical protein
MRDRSEETRVGDKNCQEVEVENQELKGKVTKLEKIVNELGKKMNERKEIEKSNAEFVRNELRSWKERGRNREVRESEKSCGEKS